MNGNITLFGIGVDIENIDKFKDIVSGQDKTLLNKIFTAREIEYCFSYTDCASHLTARYCAKEAVVKALSNLISSPLFYSEIEIVDIPGESPNVKIVRPDCEGLQVYISLSHCDDQAVAFALAVKTTDNA